MKSNTNPFTVLTGPVRSGKTLALKVMIEIAEEQGFFPYDLEPELPFIGLSENLDYTNHSRFFCFLDEAHRFLGCRSTYGNKQLEEALEFLRVLDGQKETDSMLLIVQDYESLHEQIRARKPAVYPVESFNLETALRILGKGA